MLRILVALLFLPLSAQAAIYSVTCTSTCIASDGTSQPSGTILNLVQWCGNQSQCPFTPTDGAGNPTDVALVANPQGAGTVYQPATTQQSVPALTETDCAPVSGGTCVLPAGTGLSQWNITGTIATYIVVLPPNPIVGPQSDLDFNMLGTGTITALNIQGPASTTLKTVAISAPKVYRLEYTNTGWAVLPN